MMGNMPIGCKDAAALITNLTTRHGCILERDNIVKIFLFYYRKWLTNPVRKLSQSRLDRAALEKSQTESPKLSKADKKSDQRMFRGIKVRHLTFLKLFFCHITIEYDFFEVLSSPVSASKQKTWRWLVYF